MLDWTIVAIVAFAAIAIYVVERYTRSKSIDTLDALKLGTLSAALTGGVLYTVSSADSSPAILAAVSDTGQDMFVGKPSF